MAKLFVLSRQHPSFLIIKRHLYAILSICSVIHWVINHHGVLYLAVHPHLEEMWPWKIIHVLRARPKMLKEHLCGVKRMAKLALWCHTVLKTLMVSFEFLVLTYQLIILHLALGYRLTEHAVRLPQLLHALVFLVTIGGLIGLLLIDGGH